MPEAQKESASESWSRNVPHSSDGYERELLPELKSGVFKLPLLCINVAVRLESNKLLSRRTLREVKLPREPYVNVSCKQDSSGYGLRSY